jgi:hypothetical protein
MEDRISEHLTPDLELHSDLSVGNETARGELRWHRSRRVGYGCCVSSRRRT